MKSPKSQSDEIAMSETAPSEELEALALEIYNVKTNSTLKAFTPEFVAETGLVKEEYLRLAAHVQQIKAQARQQAIRGLCYCKIMNQNEPAFPWPVPTFSSAGQEIGHSTEQPGLTKLEYASIMAMQGLLANWSAQREICNSDPRYKKQADGNFNFSEVLAINSVEFAKALLSELAKEGK